MSQTIRAGLIAAGLFALLPVAGAAQPALQPGLLPIPDFFDTTLTSGLRVLVAENHEQPAVLFQMLIPTGMRDEPAGREGLAEVVASAMTEGTQTRAADRIAGDADRLGVRLSASAEDEFTIVSCQVLAEDADSGLALFADVILNPAFRGRDVERVKRRLVTDLEQEMKDPSSRAVMAMSRLMFGPNNRLGRPGTVRSLNSIRVADAAQFFRENFFPNHAILVVIGDVAGPDMLARVSRAFGRWAPGVPLNKHVPFMPEPLAGRKLGLVNLPGKTQGHIVVGEWSIESHSPDRPAFEIVNYVFGGGSFSCRLYKTILSEQGKTYSIRSRNVYHPDFGSWGIRTFTRTAEVVNTCNALLAELRSLADSGITPEELDKARSFYRGSLPLRLETPPAVARQVLEGLYNGFTLDELRGEGIQLDAVTLEQANRVARRYFSADNFALVIVGDARQLRKPLARLGKFVELR